MFMHCPASTCLVTLR